MIFKNYTNKAYNYFINKEYDKALNYYIKLSNLLGEQFFKVNIKLCESRLEENKNNNKPIISVIIPVFNSEKYLHQCIDSILNQKIKNIEIICVDDGSTDNSLRILNEYKNIDTRVQILTQNNQHAGAARNYGLTYAHGDFIHFIDSDDWIEDNLYYDFLNNSLHNQCDIFMFSYNKYDDMTHKKNSTKYFDSNKLSINKIINSQLYKDYFLRAPIAPWNKIYKRQYIIEHNLNFDSLIIANDRSFYLKALLYNPKILISNINYYNYRINNKNSLVGIKRISNFNCHFKSFDMIKDLYYNTTNYFTILDLFLLDIKYFYEKSYELDFSTGIKIKRMIQEYFNNNKKYFDILEKYKEKQVSKFYNLINFNKSISIVFAVDNNYIKYLSVAILSLIKNASPAYNYNIYILYTDLSEENKKKILSLSTNYCKIEFHNVSYKLQKENLYSRAHYSITMYYRILIPEILKKYEKTIYLDCDILILDDISKLYYVNIENFWIAASPNLLNNDMRRYTKYKLNIDYPKYFNSGILIFNNNIWNAKNLSKYCFEFLEKNKDLVCPDQDVLNHICKNNTKYLDLKWNFAWQHIVLNSNLSDDQLDVFQKYNSQNISIIHYTSGIKPWKKTNWDNKYGNLWWDYAKYSPFYQDIIRDINKSK